MPGAARRLAATTRKDSASSEAIGTVCDMYDPQERTMPQYWIIAPVESKPQDVFDKVWKFDLDNNLISIGWKELGDVSKMSREELAQKVASTYPQKPPGAKGLVTNMIWNFYHDIGPGDRVIARRGRKILAAVGTVR